MRTEQFVISLKKEVIDDGNKAYKNILENTSINDVTDNYWKKVILFYKSLGDSERKIVLQIINQVQIDTLSAIFGILDGSRVLENQLEDFVISLSESKEVIEPEMQEIFLGIIEDEQKKTE